MSEVAIVRCDNYEADSCREAVAQVLVPLGGLDWVKPGMRIAIKANLVEAAKPEKASTTHPRLLAALTELLVRQGAEVVVGDSPGGLFNATALRHVYSATGLHLVEAAGGTLNGCFDQKAVAYPEGKVLKSFTFTQWLENADAIISFSKLKTHGMMSLTAATKNLFGAIPGTMKPEYHFRFHQTMDFANMIVDLNEYFKPRLFLVDAVVGMEGNGPTAGSPRAIGAVLAGTNCHKLDLVCARLIGLEPMQVPTLRAAADRGLCPERAEEVAVSGKLFTVEDYQLVKQNKSLQFESVLPGPLGKAFGAVARRALRAKPKLVPERCVGCGYCARLCPAKAIVIKKGKAHIARRVCIRCFCCQEFCPKGALEVRRPLVARLLNR